MRGLHASAESPVSAARTGARATPTAAAPGVRREARALVRRELVRRECMYELNLDAGRYCVEVRGEAQSTYELLLDDRPCQ